jgi:general secretion pathway protein G
MRLPTSPLKAARSTRAAFTLLEILVVVAIIVMLAGVGGYYLLQRYEEAKISTAKIEARGLAQQCETFKLNNGDYPSSIEQLAQQQPNGGAPMVPADKIMDPWGKPYQVTSDGLHAVVVTTAPNGVQISSEGK